MGTLKNEANKSFHMERKLWNLKHAHCALTHTHIHICRQTYLFRYPGLRRRWSMQYSEVFNINCIVHMPHEIDAHHRSRQPVGFFYHLLVSRWERLWWARTFDFLDQRISWSICRNYTSPTLLRDKSDRNMQNSANRCHSSTHLLIHSSEQKLFLNDWRPSSTIILCSKTKTTQQFHTKERKYLLLAILHYGRMESLWVNVIKKNPIIEPWIERRKLQHNILAPIVCALGSVSAHSDLLACRPFVNNVYAIKVKSSTRNDLCYELCLLSLPNESTNVK